MLQSEYSSLCDRFNFYYCRSQIVGSASEVYATVLISTIVDTAGGGTIGSLCDRFNFYYCRSRKNI